MKHFIILFTILYSSIGFASDELILSLGDSHLLPLRGSSNVWIQNRDVLKAEALPPNLKIIALTPGKTTLKIGKDTYSIQVIQPSQQMHLKSLKTYVQSKVGLEVDVLNGDLVISGKLFRFQDWRDLATLAKENSFSFKMKAEPISVAQKEAEEFFSGQIKQAQLPPQKIIFSPFPEVRINSSALHLEKYKEILQAFGVHILIDESHLDIQPTVKVEITVAEVRRSAAVGYGLRWPQGYKASVLGDGQREIESMVFEASAFENNGLGKILASPNILCKSGKEAEFLAGGEFPIKLVQYRNQEVIWKRYGILLKVRPLADTSGRISLSIETEITTLDEATATDNIPGILTNRVSSHFDITKPQTIALSGLLKNDHGKSSSGLPWLGRLPVLGPLFASKSFRENESELIIFVRPSIYQEDTSEQSPIHNQHLNQGDF